MSPANHEETSALWRTRLTWIAGGLLLVGGGIWLRTYLGPDAAQAQAPAAPRSAAGPPAAANPAALGARAPAGAPTPELKQLKVVAIVNGEQITRDELAQACTVRYGKDVMTNLVNKQLILQACQQRGIQVTQKELDEEMGRLAQRFGLTVEKWLDLLQSERHITAEQYRLDILWPTLALRKLAADKLVVTREELERAYESEFGAKRKVRIIVVKDKAKADKVRALAAAAPAEFARIAKEQSEDTQSAAIGGLVPPVRKNNGDPALEKIVFSLKEGEVSQVAFAADQYFIIKCEQLIPATLVKPEYYKEITERLTEQIREQKLRSSAGDVFQELQKTAQVVNVFNDEALRKQMPGVAGTINGQPVTMLKLGEECIARHGVEVLDGEINRKLLTQALRRRNLRVEHADEDAEVDRAAAAYGVSREKWLDKVVKEDGATVELYLADVVWPTVALKKLVGDNVLISQADLDLGFAKHYGERVEALVCVFSDMRTATNVFEMARANPTDAYFGDLAQQYSIEPISKNNRGQVPPIRMGGGQPAIEKAAFSLRPGELSGVIVAGDKYLVMRCTGRTKPMFQMADVRDELLKVLHEEKLREAMTAAYDQLKDSAQYDNYLTNEVHQPRQQVGAAGKAPAAARPVAAPVPGLVRPASATGPAR